MNKYRPGGRCGGSGGSGSSGSSGGPERTVSEGGLGSSLSAMMAARDRQDAMWAGPQGGQGPQVTQGQIVVATQGAKAQQGAKETRKNDMNTILQGDFAN